MQLRKQLDVQSQQQDRPGALREYGACHLVRVMHELVAVGQNLGHLAFDMPEKFLMFQLFIAKADESLQRNLISQPVVATELQHLCIDEAFDQTENVCIRAALNLTQISLVRLRKKIDLVNLRQTIGEKLVSNVKRASPDYVIFYVPT